MMLALAPSQGSTRVGCLHSLSPRGLVPPPTPSAGRQYAGGGCGWRLCAHDAAFV